MLASWEVAVPVATVWSAPEAPNALDTAVTADAPDVPAWLADLDRHRARTGLYDRLLTQALEGDTVLLLDRHESVEGWRRLALPQQPSSRDSRGYPGWVRAAHLRRLRQQDSNIMRTSREPAPGTVATPAAFVAQAMRHLGLPYLWGGMSDHGLDCSGLVHLALRRLGVVVPRDAHDQQTHCSRLAPQEVQPGDLYFFGEAGGPATHVGIVFAPSRMLHAPETGAAVLEEPLPSHRMATLTGAGRVPGLRRSGSFGADKPH